MYIEHTYCTCTRKLVKKRFPPESTRRPPPTCTPPRPDHQPQLPLPRTWIAHVSTRELDHQLGGVLEPLVAPAVVDDEAESQQQQYAEQQRHDDDERQVLAGGALVTVVSVVH